MLYADKVQLFSFFQAAVLKGSCHSKRLARCTTAAINAKHHKTVQGMDIPSRCTPRLIPQHHLDITQCLWHCGSVGQYQPRFCIDNDTGTLATEDVAVHIFHVWKHINLKVLHGSEGHLTNGVFQGRRSRSWPLWCSRLRRRTRRAASATLGWRRTACVRLITRITLGDLQLFGLPWRPASSLPIQMPGTEHSPLTLHFDCSFAPPLLLRAAWRLPHHMAIFFVGNSLDGLLKVSQIETRIAVDLLNDSVRLQSLTEDCARLCHIDTSKGNMILLGSLIRHLVENPKTNLNEGMRYEAVQVLHFQLDLQFLPISAQFQLHGASNGLVHGDIEEDEICTRLALNLQEHVPSLEQLGGLSAWNDAMHLKHATWWR
mmetsp:Transcript_89695/g.159370  ORF Transcript_89695/g.159370 Transcript_89695/m.159370 type:complete len:373 (+) Transcript_89695:1174-2292(+)